MMNLKEFISLLHKMPYFVFMLYEHKQLVTKEVVKESQLK